MSPPGLLVSDATIWSATLDSSIMIQDALFSVIYYVYSTSINYDAINVFIAQTTDILDMVFWDSSSQNSFRSFLGHII
jgi:hypothetical protein